MAIGTKKTESGGDPQIKQVFAPSTMVYVSTEKEGTASNFVHQLLQMDDGSFRLLLSNATAINFTAANTALADTF